jgi:hypothetical protein
MEPNEKTTFETVLTSGHFLGEEGDHLGEVDGTRRLAHHVVHLSVCYSLS